MTPKLMKNWIYWLATADGPRWIESKSRLDVNNQKQMDWLNREVKSFIGVIVEFPRDILDPFWATPYKEMENAAIKILERACLEIQIKWLVEDVKESIEKLESIISL